MSLYELYTDLTRYPGGEIGVAIGNETNGLEIDISIPAYDIELVDDTLEFNIDNGVIRIVEDNFSVTNCYREDDGNISFIAIDLN